MAAIFETGKVRIALDGGALRPPQMLRGFSRSVSFLGPDVFVFCSCQQSILLRR
jgi:hypothetical protein